MFSLNDLTNPIACVIVPLVKMNGTRDLTVKVCHKLKIFCLETEKSDL